MGTYNNCIDVQRLRIALRRSLLVLIGIASQGCLTAPKTATQANRSLGRALSTSYWKSIAQPERTITQSETGSRHRIVLTDFSVEFVTERFRVPLKSQLFIKPPPLDPLGILIEVIGPGRVRTPMRPDDMKSLAAALKLQFIDDLKHRGFDVVPQAVLGQQATYALLTAGSKNTDSVSSSPLLFLNPFSNDVGVIYSTTSVSAPDMRLIDNDQSGAERQRSLNTLLQKLEVNVAVSVHLVVGCWRDRAAIEQNSQISVVGIDAKPLTLRAAHSLVSERAVNAPSYFIPIVGDVQPVRQTAFVTEACDLLPKFVGPALDVAFGKANLSSTVSLNGGRVD